MVLLSLTVILLCYSTSIYASSQYNETDTDSKESKCINLIACLVNEFYPDVEVEIKNTTTIYSENGICEYVFDISSNDTDYGYIVFDSGLSNICQFIIDENAKGFCAEHFGRLLDSNEIILKTDMLNYEIKDVSDICYLGSGGGNDDDLREIFIDDFPEPMYLNFTMRCKSTGRICRFDEDTIIEKLKQNYCCAVVAMLNVCGGYRLFDINDTDSSTAAYKHLWKYSDVKYLDGEYAMDQTKMGRALAKYYRDKTGSDIPYRTKSNPTVDFFVDAVDKKYSSILGMTSRQDGGKCGHAVCVEGYFVFEPINESVYGKSQVFLSVATGWDKQVRYLWYDTARLESTYGVVYMNTFK